MALDTVLLSKNKLLHAVAETTTGTSPATPNLVNAGTTLFNVVYEPKITQTTKANLRQQQEYLSQAIPIPGAQSAKVSFRTEFFGTGSTGVPTWATALLPACALINASGTWTPFTPSSTATMTTSTVELFAAGRYKQAVGCAFNLKFTGKSGDPLFLNWEGEGAWIAPAVQAFPTGVTYPTVIPPRFAGIAVSAGGKTAIFDEFEFDIGNKLYLREDVRAASGYRACIVTERQPMLTISPESQSFGSWNPFADHIASTTYSLSFTLTGGTGNNLQFTAAKAVIVDPPDDDGNRNGAMVDKLKFLCTRNTASPDEPGNAEYALVFS